MQHRMAFCGGITNTYMGGLDMCTPQLNKHNMSMHSRLLLLHLTEENGFRKVNAKKGAAAGAI